MTFSPYTTTYEGPCPISYTAAEGGNALSSTAHKGITFDDSTRTFSVSTSTFGDAGTYTITITASCAIESVTNNSETFQIVISSVSLDPPAAGIPNMSYTIQSAAATMTFDSYTASNAGYAIGTISYTATYSSGLALDSWIVFDAATRTFTVESDDNAKFAGSPYTIKISASEDGALGLTHTTQTFTLTITKYTVTLVAPSDINDISYVLSGTA